MKSKINVLKIWDKGHHFSEANLPTLIHYKAKEWGSHYSMDLIANLVLQWSKALIVTWYSAAKEKFHDDTTILSEQIVIVNNLQDLQKYKDTQVIIIHDADEKLCLEAIMTLPDIKDRIIFIKNMDLFHKQLLTTCLTYNKLLFSWDLDACVVKGNLSKKKYNSTILFSQPKIKLPYTFVPLEKYVWYIRSKNTEWYVKSAS